MRNTGNHEYSLWVQHYGDSDSGSESDHTYDLPPSENLSEDVPVSVYRYCKLRAQENLIHRQHDQLVTTAVYILI